MAIHGKTASPGRGIRGGAAAKKATNSRASALVPTVRKLKRKGFISQRGLADELNRKGIPAPRGGRWYLTSVVRMLTRLGLITVGKGRTNQRLAVKQAADARARTLASTIRKLRKAGFANDIAAAFANCYCAWRSLRPLAAVAVGQAAGIDARAVFLPVVSIWPSVGMWGDSRQAKTLQ